MQKSKLVAVVALCMAVLLSGCGASNTVKGTGIGVGAGGAVGAGVGALAGNTALGAVIGAAVGGAAGALIGRKMDKQKKELEAAVPDATVEMVNDGEALKVTFDSGILFATNSSSVSEASRAALRNFSVNLKQNPDTYLKVIGHTDNTGRVDYNQTLSEKRAQSVYDYLMDQGVSSNRMTYEGKGIHDPVASNNTPEGRALNRRVEIMIMANEKMIQEAHQGVLK
jgi:outer membrane protein OmpA-like peptidoglycan-associated protein